MENMHEWIDPAMTSIISGVFLMAAGAIAGWAIDRIRGIKEERKAIASIKCSFDELINEHKTMALAMKNVNRANIIDICNRALIDGFISDTSFKCLCELEESYHMQHGNSYTDELIEKVKALYHNQISFPDVLSTKKA